MIIFLAIWLIPSVIFGSMIYLEHKINPYAKAELIFGLFGAVVPLLNVLGLATLLTFDEFIFFDKMKDANRVKKCYACGVSSREWQIPTIQGEKTCPVCEKSMRYYEGMNPNGRYPLAKKLTGVKLIAHLLREAKMEEMKEKMIALTAYDKELAAYEKVQMQKMEAYHKKATETLNELKKHASHT